VGFELVGVKLDQARHEEIAAEVLAALGRVVFPDFNNQAVRGRQPTPVDNAICEHDSGIGKNAIGS
jgi:hypothetical protein